MRAKQVIEAAAKTERFYHGTTSALAAQIAQAGLKKGSGVTSDPDEAAHYARQGGENSFYDRLELAGFPDPEDYDENDLHEPLYPKGEKPTVIVLDVPVLFVRQFGLTDPHYIFSKAKHLLFTKGVPSAYVVNSYTVPF
jgi:hypothetical protein